eukprot:CAMPEP_0114280180 /NCGR_PEP_ID=MMETSP0059-20121206/2300_1 /TAXON_ID=36894 /ORGANISM="Pyramimonas parkeae, Strain CCMP726" /LENGTH=83 /DNA_ID=CAMNT_0001400563 /DNA_START=1161 /DNA_END=1412 /DNA_ORIENTATION=-
MALILFRPHIEIVNNPIGCRQDSHVDNIEVYHAGLVWPNKLLGMTLPIYDDNSTPCWQYGGDVVLMHIGDDILVRHPCPSYMS